MMFEIILQLQVDMTNLEYRFNSKKGKLTFPQFNLKLERGIKQGCEICKATYNVFKKQHICKRCFRSVCAECSPFKVKTYLANRNVRLHRNCSICNQESIKIQQYIDENKLQFAHDSDLLYIWSKTLMSGKGLKVGRSKSNLNVYLDLENLWSSLNFSFREFIGRLIQKSNMNDADLTNLISNGLQQIENFYADRLEDALYIYLFFLCHSDLETAVNLTLFLLDLVDKTKDTLSIIKKSILNIGFSEVQMYKIEEFILDNELVLKDSATINVLPVTASFDIVNSAITSKSIHFLWKGVLLLLFERKEVVFKHLNRINVILIDLLRNPNFNLKAQKLVTDSLILKEQEIKYSNLEKDYQQLKNRNERLERQLSQISQKGLIKNKVLSDSLFSEESVITSNEDFTISPLKFKPQEFNQILELKNEEIIKLKMKNEQLQQTSRQKTAETERMTVQSNTLKEQANEKDRRLLHLEQQNKNLKGINQLLIQKMKQLSKMLMDQEQKQISKNEQVLEEIKQSYEQLSMEKKEECNIF